VSVASIFKVFPRLTLLKYVVTFAMTSKVLLSSTLSKRHKDKVGVISVASTGPPKYGLLMMTLVKLSLKLTLIVSIFLAISVVQRRIQEVPSNVTTRVACKASMLDAPSENALLRTTTLWLNRRSQRILQKT
jgi:hypothetical protein